MDLTDNKKSIKKNDYSTRCNFYSTRLYMIPSPCKTLRTVRCQQMHNYSIIIMTVWYHVLTVVVLVLARVCWLSVVASPLCWLSVVASPLCWLSVAASPLCWLLVVALPLCWLSVVDRQSRVVLVESMVTYM